MQAEELRTARRFADTEVLFEQQENAVIEQALLATSVQGRYLEELIRQTRYLADGDGAHALAPFCADHRARFYQIADLMEAYQKNRAKLDEAYHSEVANLLGLR